jgi:hypothetical protein
MYGVATYEAIDAAVDDYNEGDGDYNLFLQLARSGDHWMRPRTQCRNSAEPFLEEIYLCEPLANAESRPATKSTPWHPSRVAWTA